MREIKFSLYVPSDGGMRKYTVTSIRYTRYGEREISEVHIGDARVDGKYLKTGEVHLVQYTGLKDKNGKEIYEGDILPYRYVVTFVDASDSANLGMSVGWYEQRDDFESFRQLEVGDELEVIGNIYENPELLEVSQ